MNNTTLYGSLSGPDDNGATHKKPYNTSSKGDCGCNGAKRMPANNLPQQRPPRYYPPNNPMPNPPNNPIPYPSASQSQNLPRAYPSKVNTQTQNMAINQMTDPLLMNK